MSGLLEVGQAVLSAQGKIIKECLKRYSLRIGFLIVALVCLGFAAITLHGVLWALFMQLCHFSPLVAAACVLGVDVLLVVIFFLCALWTGRVRSTEQRARIELGHRWHEFRQFFALSTLLNVVGKPAGKFAGGQAWRLMRHMFSRRKK